MKPSWLFNMVEPSGLGVVCRLGSALSISSINDEAEEQAQSERARRMELATEVAQMSKRVQAAEGDAERART